MLAPFEDWVQRVMSKSQKRDANDVLAEWAVSLSAKKQVGFIESCTLIF